MIALIRERDGSVLELPGTLRGSQVWDGRLVADALASRDRVDHGYVDEGYRASIEVLAGPDYMGIGYDPARIRTIYDWITESRGIDLVSMQREGAPLVTDLLIVRISGSFDRFMEEPTVIDLQEARFASTERIFFEDAPPPPPRPDVAGDLEDPTEAGRRGFLADLGQAFTEGRTVGRGGLQ